MVTTVFQSSSVTTAVVTAQAEIMNEYYLPVLGTCGDLLLATSS